MATFWSTSRNELWIKGKTSGDYLAIEEVRVNCEQNSLYTELSRWAKVHVIQKTITDRQEKGVITEL